MKVKNRLQEILQGIGIKSMVPTDNILTNKLGGMTLIRFNKLYNNSGPTEITVQEMTLLTEWLADIMDKEVEDIDLLVRTGKEAIEC